MVEDVANIVRRLFPMQYSVVGCWDVVISPHTRIKRSLEIAGVYRKPKQTKEFNYKPKTAPAKSKRF